MIGGVTRQGRVARSVRPSNPLSRGQGGATRLAGVGFAILNSRKISPQHWGLQQKQQACVEEHQSPKNVVCQHFSCLRT